MGNLIFEGSRFLWERPEEKTLHRTLLERARAGERSVMWHRRGEYV